MKRTIPFYNEILALGAMYGDVQGVIHAILDGQQLPARKGSKSLMLPVPEVIARPNKEDILIFHPLQEHVIRGETEIMMHYRETINLVLNVRLMRILGYLVTLAASPSDHQHLKPEHLPTMQILMDIDKKSITDLQPVFKAMPMGDPEKCFAHIYIKKNAQLAGRNYRRAAVVSFPFYEQLLKEDGLVFGCKLRKKDRAALKGLFEAMFPGIEEKNSYSRGGDSELAPTLSALLKAMVVLADQVTSMASLFEDVITDMTPLKYSDDWVEDALNLDSFAGEVRMVPSQVGNEGSLDHRPADQAQQGGTHNTGVPQAGQPLWNLGGHAQTQTASNVLPKPDASGKLSYEAFARANPALAMASLNSYSGIGMAQKPLSPADALRAQGPSWGMQTPSINNVNF